MGKKWKRLLVQRRRESAAAPAVTEAPAPKAEKKTKPAPTPQAAPKSRRSSKKASKK